MKRVNFLFIAVGRFIDHKTTGLTGFRKWRNRVKLKAGMLIAFCPLQSHQLSSIMTENASGINQLPFIIEKIPTGNFYELVQLNWKPELTAVPFLKI